MKNLEIATMNLILLFFSFLTPYLALILCPIENSNYIYFFKEFKNFQRLEAASKTILFFLFYFLFKKTNIKMW